MPFNPQGPFPKVLSDEELAEKRAEANANTARREAEAAQAKREASLGYRLARRVKNLWMRIKRPFTNGGARPNTTTGTADSHEQSGQTVDDTLPVQSVRSMQAIHLIHSDQPGYETINDRRVQSYYDGQFSQTSQGGVLSLQGAQGIRSLHNAQGPQTIQDGKAAQDVENGQDIQSVKKDESKVAGHDIDTSLSIRPVSIDGPTLVV